MRISDKAIVIILASAIFAVPLYALYSHYRSVSSMECVQIGEPLYPGTMKVPISTFTREWSSQPFNYKIEVNETTHSVTILSTHFIGFVNLDKVTTPLIGC